MPTTSPPHPLPMTPDPASAHPLPITPDPASAPHHPSPITPHPPKSDQKRFWAGFTLIEVMLVVVIIGIMAAVIVPRAWRANIDTKYATLRQTCAQLAGYANDWAVRQLETQGTGDDAILADYLNSLAGVTSGSPTSGGPHWIAVNAASNWNDNPTTTSLIGVDKRGTPVTSIVKNLVPEASPLRNPFTGLDVFQQGNDNGAPGAIACGYRTDGSQNYYALIFRSASDTSVYHAGMHSPPTLTGNNLPDLAGLRNGIFIASVTP